MKTERRLMTATQIIFLIVSAVTLGSAVMVVGARRVMHAALWLVLVLLGVAILFALLETRFFAVVQVLVYIGAIAILIIFAVMLTQKVMIDVGSQVNRNFGVAVLAAVGSYAGIIWILSHWAKFNEVNRAVPSGGEDLVKLGQSLVDPAGYVIPFEIASVLLLAAMVGAIYIAVDRRGGRS
jgi:NADH-quinone oxidoreductase subunit J